MWVCIYLSCFVFFTTYRSIEECYDGLYFHPPFLFCCLAIARRGNFLSKSLGSVFFPFLVVMKKDLHDSPRGEGTDLLITASLLEKY